MYNFCLLLWVISVDIFLFFITRLFYKLFYYYCKPSSSEKSPTDYDSSFWSKGDFE